MATKQTQLPEKSIETLLAEANSEPLGANKRPIGEDTLAKLGSMTKPELIALIRVVSGALWGYATLTKEEKREALRLKIYSIAMQSSQDAVTLKAANDWLDREEGKAMQRSEVKAVVATFDVAEHRRQTEDWTNSMFERLASISGSKPVTIDAPKPK